MKRRDRVVLVVLLLCSLALWVPACKDVGSGSDGSSSGFRLSLSKREVPVANEAAH
jgi:hypothetical protein